jgi:hypothetical protein
MSTESQCLVRIINPRPVRVMAVPVHERQETDKKNHTVNVRLGTKRVHVEGETGVCLY